jgi:SsrA-binding protein
MKRADSPDVLVCRNTRAGQKYTIEQTMEAGMVLTGSEVKSLRAKHADLEGAYAAIFGNVIALHNMHIGPYEQAGRFGHEPKRERRLLLHQHEIERLRGLLSMKGYTLVPLKVYFKHGKAKVELGLAKARAHEDKRETIQRELDLREAREAMRRR